jgi:hypothetical protein
MSRTRIAAPTGSGHGSSPVFISASDQELAAASIR